MIRLRGHWAPRAPISDSEIDAAAERITWGQLKPAWHHSAGDRLAREIRSVALAGGGRAEISEFHGAAEWCAAVDVEVQSRELSEYLTPKDEDAVRS